jgi:hypothetical protein
MSLSSALFEATYLRQKPVELERTAEAPGPTLCDTQGAISLFKKETIRYEVKHIHLRYDHVDIDFDISTKWCQKQAHRQAINLLRITKDKSVYLNNLRSILHSISRFNLALTSVWKQRSKVVSCLGYRDVAKHYAIFIL